MDQRLQKGQLKAKRPYKRKNVIEAGTKGPGKKGKRKNSAQLTKQIAKRPYNKKNKDIQLPIAHKGRPSQAQLAAKNAAANLIHIEVGTTQVKQNVAKNSQFNPKGLMIIDKLSEFANNYLQNPPRNEDSKKKRKLIEDSEWNSLSERKKNYFSIINNYPYLKYIDENSNKEKLMKKSDINIVDDQEGQNNKIEDKIEEEQQNIQDNQEAVEELVQPKIELSQELIREVQIKEENSEVIDETKVNNNKIEDDLIINNEEDVKEEPKQVDSIEDIKEENDNLNQQQSQNEQQANKNVKIYSEGNILIIEEKIEDESQQVKNPITFERQNLVKFLQTKESENLPSFRDKFQALYQENNLDINNILKEQFSQFTEDTSQLIEGIKSENFYTKIAHILEDIFQSYDLCLEQEDKQDMNKQKQFFDNVIEQTQSQFDKINTSLDLKDDLLLSIQKLMNVIHLNNE